MLIQKFKDSGRVAVRYPRKRLVSVSGRSMPEKDAIETMKRILDKEAEVKESSEELHEMQELYAVVDENDIVIATASNELAAKRSISSSELPPLSVKDKSKLRIVKTRKQAEVDKPLKEHATPTLEDVELEEAVIDVKKYKCGSEKSQFGGYRPHILNKETGKTLYLGQASYNTTAEAKAHAENYLKQYAQGIEHPKVPVKGTYMKEELEEINLQTVRTMKIISLATGCTDSAALYEYALTAPTYSSLVELKENFNRYIQDT